MGKLIAALKRFPKRTSAIVAVVAAAVVIPATLFAWGPSRATFTEQNPAPYITFNSITNNSFYGDERNFVTIKDASNTQDGGWSDKVTVQPGKEYVVRMYVHNNAADNLNLVAENVRASATVPTTTGKTVPISGFVSADNANPTKVWDDVELTSDKDFNLAYVPGSASFNNNGIGNSPEGAKLSDSIVTSTGALLGYDKLDGKIPGCYKYSGYVYFKVKPQFGENPNFTTSKYVSKHGANTWVKDYQAHPGETVDYLLNYKNTGDTYQENVHIKDTLPAGMTYVPGSTTIHNAANPNGIKTDDGITANGLNIGTYQPGANAWLTFSAKLPAQDKLECGENTLKNLVRTTASGYYKEDNANVKVKKECQPDCKYSCDMLKVDKLSDTNFKFTVTTTEANATFKKVTYIIRNEQGAEVERKESTAKILDYTRTTVGKFTVEAVVTFSVNGQDKTATSANCKKPFEVTEQPVYTCDSLTVTRINRTNFKFAATHTVKGGTLKSTEYVIRNEQGTEIARQTSSDYTQTTIGKYTVEAILTFTINGQDKVVTDAKCKKPFEVEKEPETPVYTCDSLTFTKISRLEYSFTGKATATGGATIVDYTFNFGDGSATQTVTNPTAVKHTYAKAGEYTVAMSVRVKIGNEEKTVDGANCKVKVTVSPEECKPGIPVGDDRCVEQCKPGIPVGDDRCKEECKPGIPMGDARCEEKPCVPGKDAACTEIPKELPKTGAGDSIVALIGAGSLIAALGYYIASRRQLGA